MKQFAYLILSSVLSFSAHGMISLSPGINAERKQVCTVIESLKELSSEPWFTYTHKAFIMLFEMCQAKEKEQSYQYYWVQGGVSKELDTIFCDRGPLEQLMKHGLVEQEKSESYHRCCPTALAKWVLDGSEVEVVQKGAHQEAVFRPLSLD